MTDEPSPTTLHRRSFLKGAAGVGAGIAAAGPFSALAARSAAASPSSGRRLTIPGAGNTATKLHGYNFEVPADGMATGNGGGHVHVITDTNGWYG